MKKIIFCIVLLLLSKPLLAQHPVFTHLTEKDGLPDIEFYAIVEDKEGFIWLAADKGLFRYDGKEFKNYTHSKKRGLSVFGLKIDEKGRVWCNNISGQFFYIENNKLILFKDLKEEVKGQLSIFSFYQNDLIISTETGFYKIDVNDLSQKKLFDRKVGFYPFYVKNDGIVYLYDHEIRATTKNEEPIVKFDLNEYKKFEFNKWDITSFMNADLVYAYNTNNLNVKPKLFYEQGTQLKEVYLPVNLQKNVAIKFYEEEGKLWACTEGGVFVYEFQKGILKYKSTYFKGKAISGFLKDRNNNYWFTTLRSGVFIVPNLHIEKYNLEEEKTNISAMSRVGKGSLIIGSTKGHIAILNKKDKELKFIKKIYKEKVYSICDSKEKVYLSLGVSSLVYDKNRKSIYKETFCSNAKDLSLIDESNILYASHGSATIVNVKNKSIVPLKRIRAYTTHFSKNKEIYVGYVDGVEKYSKEKKVSEILFKEESIFAIDIDETSNEIIWISTFKDGIIGIKNGEAIINYTKENGLLSNRSGKIKGDGELLWVATDNGLQVLNSRTGRFKNLTKKDGINSFNISEIIPFEKEVFFSSNKGLFKINKEKVFKNRSILDFSFTSIKIDDKEKTEKENYILTSNNKKIQFNFHTNGFLSEDNIVYKYKLIETSKKSEWNTVDNRVGQITFNNLAAGEYEFQLKAVHINGEKESIIKSIKLKVKPPFYKEPWFILGVLLLLFVLIWYYFTRRILKLRIKQKEALEKERMQKQLVASKLESLQSQMNPHFTFNALNSIQNLVLKGDKYEAYDYLTKFSLLIRESLSMSKKSFVVFEEEVRMLTKYLELEKLRFRDNFEYIVKGVENISDIKIPTMIIQPYVENAIKHGVLHKKEGKRQVVLEFIQKEVLICIIMDNGIGREESRKINEKNDIKRESFSTKAIEERLVFLKDYYKTDIGVAYEDILVGTKVVIKIPYSN